MDDIVRQYSEQIKRHCSDQTAYNSLGGKDTLRIQPEDEETVFAVFQLLSALSANRKAFAQITTIQDKGCHNLYSNDGCVRAMQMSALQPNVEVTA